MMYSFIIEADRARARCEAYRNEAERRRILLAVGTTLNFRKGVALGLHALANWLEPAASSSHHSSHYAQPKLKGGL